MIQINKGLLNTVALTLTESSILESPVFLFEFINDQEKTSKYFIAIDSSLFTERYNKFSITEKSNPNPLIGEVEMTLTGFWSYKVFEQISITNLNPALCDNTEPLEMGKVLVIGTAVAEHTHNYDPDIVVYNG